MILQELKLCPFAGLACQELTFVPGLNVILGPNEAGKSTIVNALKLVLFMPTRYTKTTFDKEIRRYLPLSGGDTIQVELGFLGEADNRPYRLSKSWGARAESRLILADGGLLADPLAVQEKMRELLVLTEGTYHNVLFAYQSRLGTTLEALREEPEARHQLADLLRRSLYETDGVSVDRLELRLHERLEQYFSHWDRDLGRPEGGRGLEDPWKRKVGRILQAYYDQELRREKLREAQEYERELDALNERLRRLGEEVGSLREYVQTHQKLVADAQQRLLKTAQLDSLRKEAKELKEICQKWPVLEKETDEGTKLLERSRQEQENLAKELAEAQAYEALKEARELFQRAEKKRQALEEAKAALKNLKRVTAADLETLQDLNLRLAECRARLSAGKLQLHFTPRVPVTVEAARDLEEAATYPLQAGQTLELDAGGRLFLAHADWELMVRSGEVDFEEVEREYTKVQGEVQGHLQRLKVASLQEAQQAHEAYREQLAKVRTLEADLEEILAGKSYDELKAALPGAEPTPPTRPSAEVALRLGEVRTAISQMEKQLAEKRAQLSTWQEAHHSLDRLLDRQADVRADLRRLERELKALTPLPPQITDVAAFIAEFEEQERQLKIKEQEFQELLLERADFQTQAPEETAEEILPQLREAERLFAEALQEGQALLAIQEAFAEVKAAMDGQTLAPWLEDLQNLLGTLTGGRYVTVEFPPQGVEKARRQDGLEVPAVLLSGGAKVSFGLAMRLSMAAHFLHGLGGFLVMDDPLVDLDDAGRQQAAVRVIQEFAREKQVIVLTCKQSHADLLGGHRLDLQ